jgi:hypothetical protein
MGMRAKTTKKGDDPRADRREKVPREFTSRRTARKTHLALEIQKSLEKLLKEGRFKTIYG